MSGAIPPLAQRLYGMLGNNFTFLHSRACFKNLLFMSVIYF